jgi:hypothetical protein
MEMVQQGMEGEFRIGGSDFEAEYPGFPIVQSEAGSEGLVITPQYGPDPGNQFDWTRPTVALQST